MTLEEVLEAHEYGYESRAVPSAYCSCGWENEDEYRDDHRSFAAHVAEQIRASVNGIRP